MYSLWKEVSDQIKKKAEDLNSTLQELNISNTPKGNDDAKSKELNEDNSDKSLKSSIHDKLNLINNKYLNRDTGELQYYNKKFISGFNNIKKMVGGMYKDKLHNLNNYNSNKEKVYLSKIIPWKKADIMISKIYRKKYNEGFPINLPDNNLNNEVHEMILKLNTDKNRIINTKILEKYNFNWIKKKEQSEQIMQEDENLITTKNFLVPYYMSELNFWKSYFFNIDIIYNEIADEIYDNKKMILMGYNYKNTADVLKNQSDDHNNSNCINNNNYLLINETNVIQNVKEKDARSSYEYKKNSAYNLNETCNTNSVTKDASLIFENEINKRSVHFENSSDIYRDKNNLFKTSDRVNITVSANNPNEISCSAKESYSSTHSNDDIVSSLCINNIDTNMIREEETSHNTDNYSSKSVGEKDYIKKTKINGLDIYMDNEIYLNLSNKSNNFPNFLNNYNDCDQKSVDISLCPDKAINFNDLSHDDCIASENFLEVSMSPTEHISIKEKVDNNACSNEMKNTINASLSISDYNLKLLEEVATSNKKMYASEDHSNSYEFLSQNKDSNEIKRDVYSSYEWKDYVSNHSIQNHNCEENAYTQNFIDYKDEKGITNIKNNSKEKLDNPTTSNNINDTNAEFKNNALNEKEEMHINIEYKRNKIITNKSTNEDISEGVNLLNNYMDDGKVSEEFKNREKLYEVGNLNISSGLANFDFQKNDNTECNTFFSNVDGVNNSDKQSMGHYNKKYLKETNLLSDNNRCIDQNTNYDVCSNNLINEKRNAQEEQHLISNDTNVTDVKYTSKESNDKENFIFNNLNDLSSFNYSEEAKKNQKLSFDELLGFSDNNEKIDPTNLLKSSDINIDDLNLVDDIEFDFNKFNAEELEQFEKDLLNT